MGRFVSRQIDVKPGELLKGSHVVAAGKDYVQGVILECRNSPRGFGAPFIIDFDNDVLPGIHSWPCNMTETRRLAQLIGDDMDKWEGWGLVLDVTRANNPKTDREVDSLTVGQVVSPKDLKRTTAAKYTKAAAPSNSVHTIGSTRTRERSKVTF